MKYPKINDTIYFWFGANDTAGSGNDGASAVYDVRLGGASSSGAPTLSGNATLLTHANYPAGCYEVEIAVTVANGFAADGQYAVFSTLAVDAQNPTGFIGEFQVGPVQAILADGVAHGGTPGSSTATLALNNAWLRSNTSDAALHVTAKESAAITIDSSPGYTDALVELYASASTGGSYGGYALGIFGGGGDLSGGGAGPGIIISGGGSAGTDAGGDGIIIRGGAADPGVTVDGGTALRIEVNNPATTPGDAVKIRSFGFGKHDINLAGSGDMLGDLNGTVNGVGVYKKAVAVTKFMFAMKTSAGAAATGLTVTAAISKNGGAFAAVAGAVSELSGGWYYVDLTGTEMTADEVALKFTATGALQQDVKIRTQS